MATVGKCENQIYIPEIGSCDECDIFEQRLTQAENDIDTLEGNVTNLQNGLTEAQDDISDLQDDVIHKQNELTAGSNITIDENNVISARGFVNTFGRELEMSVNPWSSGECVVTGSDDYMVFLIVQRHGTTPGVYEDPMIGCLHNGYIWASLATGNEDSTNYTQTIRTFSARTNGDTWTMRFAKEVSHRAGSDHGAGSDDYIVKIIGLIPKPDAVISESVVGTAIVGASPVGG